MKEIAVGALAADFAPAAGRRRPEWAGAASTADFVYPWPAFAALHQSTLARLAYTPDWFYVRFEASAETVRASRTERKGDVFRDDCLEIFLAPPGPAYWAWEVNALGSLLDYTTRIGPPLDFDYGWESRAELAVAVYPGDAWTLELRLPWSDFGLAGPPTAGSRWGLALNRVALDAAGAPSYSSWAPFPAEPASFHQPARFGSLVFA
jgi:hypothetical protein